MKKGAFTAQAKRAGMGVQEFAKEVLDNQEDFTQKTIKRAQFARNMKSDKMAHGGKTQGYNSQLDESMGMRLGREKDYKQSLKDRRDESKAANKMLGRRAYSSVQAMDKGDRMMMEGGRTEFEHGGKMKQGYDAREDESLGMRTGRESSKQQSMKARRDDSYGKFGKRDEEAKKRLEELRKELRRDMLSYEDIAELQDLSQHIDKDDTELRQAAGIPEFEHGGYHKKMARGGSVEGKIDRDRFVKLRREKDKEIKKLRKEKGALRKDLREKDCDTEIEREVKSLKKDIGKKVSESVAKERKVFKERAEQVKDSYEEEIEGLEEEVRELKKGRKTSSKRENNEALLLGGIAGILFGAFFNR